jgi:hypothetical protein
MNTTATAVSAISTFFSTKEAYLSFKAHWKDLANQKAITLDDAALRILVLNQDALRAMPPTTNPVRLANGALQDSGLFRAMSRVRYEANRAQQVLNKRAKGDTATASPFAERWAKHGITLEALASLADKANANNFMGAR